MVDEIDFIAEHPKMDMLSVDVFKVNGKKFVSIDRISKITDGVYEDLDALSYKLFRVLEEIEKLKGE